MLFALCLTHENIDVPEIQATYVTDDPESAAFWAESLAAALPVGTVYLQMVWQDGDDLVSADRFLTNF